MEVCGDLPWPEMLLPQTRQRGVPVEGGRTNPGSWAGGHWGQGHIEGVTTESPRGQMLVLRKDQESRQDTNEKGPGGEGQNSKRVL